MLAKISQHTDMPVTVLLTPFLASSTTSNRPSPHLKNPNTNPAKHFLPIDATTPSTETITDETNTDLGRNVVSFAIKRVVGPQSTQRKNGKNQRDGLRNVSRNASLRTSTELRDSTLLNTKVLTMVTTKTEKKKMEWMR